MAQVGGGSGTEPSADEVDGLIAAWARELPQADLSALAVLSRVHRLSRLLDRVRRSAFSQHDLEPSEFDVLAALRRSGAPYVLSPGHLVAQTLVTSGTMTHRINRLEGKGLVRRQPDPSDGRGVLVHLTAAGRERVDAALAALLEEERRLLAMLPAEQQSTLAALLRRVLVPLDEADPATSG